MTDTPIYLTTQLDAALADYTPGIDLAVRFVSIDQVDMLAEFYLHNRRADLPACLPWRDIKSAPRDYTPFIGWMVSADGAEGWMLCRFKRDSGVLQTMNYYINEWVDDEETLTHWIPDLPGPTSDLPALPDPNVMAKTLLRIANSLDAADLQTAAKAARDFVLSGNFSSVAEALAAFEEAKEPKP